MPNRVGMAKADLRRVERARAALRESQDEFRAAIVAARASGETLRDIAESAGVSHQMVWKMLNEPRRER